MGLASGRSGASSPAAASRVRNDLPDPLRPNRPRRHHALARKETPMTTITIAARYARYLLTSLAAVAFGMAVN